MDMNLVRTFVTVFQQNSFTRAADILSVSQPAVSMSIRRLESQVGGTLFVKNGRSIAPTARAIELADKLQQGLQIIDSALSSENRFKVYCLEGLSHLLSHDDRVTFKVPPIEQHVLFDQLRSQQIDLAIDTTTNKDSAFQIDLIRREPIVLIAREGHPRINKDKLTKAEFYQESHVVYKTTRDGRQLLDLFTAAPLKERIVSREVYNQASMAMNVSDSDDIGVVFKTFAEKWATRLNLKICELPMESLTVPIHMLYHRRLEHDSAHKKVRNQLKKALKNNT